MKKCLTPFGPFCDPEMPQCQALLEFWRLGGGGQWVTRECWGPGTEYLKPKCSTCTAL